MSASTRITYVLNTAGGTHLANAVQYAQLAQREIAAAKAVADSITTGGVTPANLEGSTEFNAATGQGGALYTAIANLNSNLASVTASAIGQLAQL